jgi:hypothetical protein
MEYIPRAGEEFVIGCQVADVALIEDNLRICLVLSQIRCAATHQIIDDPDPEPSFHEKIDHVAANETGATGDHGKRSRRH